MKPTPVVLTALAFALAVSLAACGATRTAANTGAAATPSPCSTATPGGAANRGGGRGPWQMVDALPVTTLPPAVTVGRVQVVIQDIGYGLCAIPANRPLNVYAGNGLDRSIYAADHRSGCSIFTIERWVSAAWRPVAMCLLDSPTRLVDIPSLTSNFAQIKPEVGATWPTGVYRAAFAYHVGLASDSTAETVVYSTPFTIVQ
jgi:hypothetical protein